MDDFLACAAQIKKSVEEEEARPVQPAPRPVLPGIELTQSQKRLILEYALGDLGKGLFEDCPEFWDGVEDIDAAYPALREAANDYVEGLRQRLLGELTCETSLSPSE